MLIKSSTTSFIFYRLVTCYITSFPNFSAGCCSTDANDDSSVEFCNSQNEANKTSIHQFNNIKSSALQKLYTYTHHPKNS